VSGTLDPIPFSTTLGPRDFRAITKPVASRQPFFGLPGDKATNGAIPSTGRASPQDKPMVRLAAGRCTSMASHESQSLFW